MSQESLSHAKQISVSSTIPRHEGPFWSVLNRLSAISSKFSNKKGRELKRGWLSSPTGCISFSREDGDERGGTLKYCDSTNQRNI